MEPKGKTNLYVCQECGKYIKTINRDEGTTPFMVPCLEDDCAGMMMSCFYQVPPAFNKPPTHEWFKPSNIDKYLEEAVAPWNRDQTREHIEKGGLVLKNIPGAFDNE